MILEQWHISLPLHVAGSCGLGLKSYEKLGSFTIDFRKPDCRLLAHPSLCFLRKTFVSDQERNITCLSRCAARTGATTVLKSEIKLCSLDSNPNVLFLFRIKKKNAQTEINFRISMVFEVSSSQLGSEKPLQHLSLTLLRSTP